MMKLQFWSFLLGKLKENQPVHLHVVTQHKGSSPGKQGAKMLQSRDGELRGTIGGGIMEYNLLEKGRESLKSPAKDVQFVKFTHRREAEKDSEPSGLICAGSQTLCSAIIFPDQLPDVEGLCQALETGCPVWITIDENKVAFVRTEPKCTNHGTEEPEILYAERLNKTHEIFIFGSGHIGQALASNCELLDYTYHLFPTPEKESDLAGLSALISSCEQAYAVVVTSGSNSDILCMKALLDCPLEYCGIMGSQSKLNHIFQQVFSSENKPEWFDRIHAPIGIPIHSHSPAEIAVSIAAELISLINSQKR